VLFFLICVYVRLTFLQEAIYYSDGASTVTSTIPAFSKRGDLIIMDEACNDAIVTGVELSRSTLISYRHNDMDHLREILTSIAADDKRKRFDTRQQRRFIVTEGLFRLVGDLCPLNEIMKLKEQFCYRLILDESTSFGVVGKTGRGVTELFGVDIADVEIITISVDTALASVGGLCVGSHEIVDHQRLSGAGYCFSAASPPFLAVAALTSLRRLDESGEALVESLQKRSERALTTLRKIKGFRVAGDECGNASVNYSSPVIHISVIPSESHTWEEDEMVINQAVEMCLQRGVGVTSAKYSSDRISHMNKQRIRPSLKVCLSTALTLKEVETATSVIRKCCEAAAKSSRE
jgi:serine palmitoyltransferase